MPRRGRASSFDAEHHHGGQLARLAAAKAFDTTTESQPEARTGFANALMARRLSAVRASRYKGAADESLMRCGSCQHENPADFSFCEECANPLGRTCPSCGASASLAAKFCGKCSVPLAAQSSAGPDRDPRAYTPKHLADKILQSKSALEGERKQVTVLFADVKGSMDLSAQMDPEEWHRILDRFFEILTEGVHRFEGTVNQYTGDGIMALFGAPMFMGLGDLAGGAFDSQAHGVSADGNVVVGHSVSTIPSHRRRR